MKRALYLLYAIASLVLALGFAEITYEIIFKDTASSFHPLVSGALSICMFINCFTGFKRFKELINK